MRHSALRSVASASLLLALCAVAATRPHYGGALRLEMRAAPALLDPADAAAARFMPLLFDTLVVLDSTGEPQPALARGWQSRNDGRRWQFALRHDLKLSDGMPLTSAQVAAALLAANPGWRATALGDAVVLEFDAPRPHLPAELARPHNAIVVRGANGALLGTGPYRIAEFQPGRRAVLIANDDYWGGRAFLDSIQVGMGRAYRDQLLDLDTGRADVIEVAPEQARRALQEGRRVELSSPIELLALQFPAGRPATEDVHLRQAVALAVDRVALNNGLLQHQGEPAGALLPQWLSGYAFLFPATADLARAREARPSSYSGLTIGYDAADPLARVVAERVALNARDAGLILQVSPCGTAAPGCTADARIVRLKLDSSDPGAALIGVAGSAEQSAASAATPEALYAAECALLDDYRTVPLVHIPEAYAVGTRVRNWAEPRAGGWPLGAVWLDQRPASRKDQP